MIAYFLKVILCSALLYLLYVLLLEKEKFYRFNRYYLLFSILFSFTAPLITFHHGVPFNPVDQIGVQGGLQAIVFNDSDSVLPVAAPVPERPDLLPMVLWSLYLVTTALFLFRFLRNLWSMISTIRRNEQTAWKGARLVLTAGAAIPYSFLNYIFLDGMKYRQGAIEKEILQHELAHVRQRHSLDILLIELLLTFAWFILPLFLFKRAIATNHEYLADQNVVNTFDDTVAYKMILLNKSCLNYHLILSSSFNYLITKKRLTMMTRTTSPRIAILKQIALIPFVAAIGLIVSTSATAQDHPKQSSPKQAAGQQAETPKNMKDAPQSVVDEYHALLEKYNIRIVKVARKPQAATETSNPLSEKANKGPEYRYELDSNRKLVNQADWIRMEHLFLQMSKEQQRHEHFLFHKIPDLLTTRIPTNQQMEQWKDPKMYGIWIGPKRIKNNLLSSHKNTEFQHYELRTLSPADAKVMKYKVEVALTTVAAFKSFNDFHLRQKKENHGRDYMMIGFTPPTIVPEK